MTEEREDPEVVKCETPEEQRAHRKRLAEEGMELGLSEDDAYMIVDMVQHAKMKAYDAIEAVANTAPRHLRSFIRMETLDHLASAIKASKEHLDEGRNLALLSAILGRTMLDRANKQKTQPN